MQMRDFPMLIILLMISSIASSQDVLIKRLELENEKVFLFYELKDTTRGRYYTINVYSSHDNFINPLKNVQGDLGLEMLPGSNRKIEINAKNEFGVNYEGKIAFELRAKLYIPFIRLDKLNQKFKRGKTYELHWTGGRPQNILNFDLLKDGEKIHTFSGIGNTGKYNLILPPDTKPGKNYHFRISDSKNKDEIVNSGKFVIARKFPLLFKAVPMMIVGGALYFVLKPEEDCADCLVDFPNPEN